MGFSPFGSTVVLDTPFEGLAKIGILGHMLLALALFSVLTKLRKAVTAETLSIFRGYQGWLIVLVALVPFGTVWQDKGLPIAIMLAYALGESIASREERRAKESEQKLLE